MMPMRHQALFLVLLLGRGADAFVYQQVDCRHYVPFAVAFEAEVCTKGEAEEIVGSALVAEAGDESIWVKATDGNGMAAVARLRTDSATIDGLRLNFPKENFEDAKEALGKCVDKLLVRWLLDEKNQYEALGAATDAHSAHIFEMRGFFELQRPDLTALARGLPIVTHKARLAPAIFAFQFLEASSDTNFILTALRNQPPPSSSGLNLQLDDSTNLLKEQDRVTTTTNDQDQSVDAANTGAASESLDSASYDPWRGVGKTFF